MEKRAYLLFSGGLDSIIAAKLLQKLGFEVVGVYVSSPFFEKNPEKLKELAKKLGIELEIVEADGDYLEMLKNPLYGYGKNINPCIDCKAYMLKKLKKIAGDKGIIATGEVLGQRPMSQNLQAFMSIEKLSGLKARVLRPPSGKLLPPTIYEEKGIVERDKLLDFRGRSRKRYPEVLKNLGIDMDKLPTPAGGCLLTGPSFAVKVRDLIEHNELTWENVKLLKVGRHFRVGGCKLVVGRNREENAVIRKTICEGDYLLTVPGVPSPDALLRCNGKPGKEVLRTAAGIVARYSDAKDKPEVEVIIYRNGKLLEKLKVRPIWDLAMFSVTQKGF